MGNIIVGLQVTAIGFGTVFVVLMILMIYIGVQSNILSGGKKTEAAPKATPAPAAAPAPTPAAPKQDDNELVAVIAAAIAASGGSTKAVRSISRINGTAGPSWTVASKNEAMASRL